MIRTIVRSRFGALLWVTAPLFLAGCDSGVKNPEAWLHENITHLNDVVTKLRESSIIWAQSSNYKTTAKYLSDADAALYDELKKFIDRTGVISISVARGIEGDPPALSGISFHVKETWKPFELSAVSVVYTESGEDPEHFFWGCLVHQGRGPFLVYLYLEAKVNLLTPLSRLCRRALAAELAEP